MINEKTIIGIVIAYQILWTKLTGQLIDGKWVTSERVSSRKKITSNCITSNKIGHFKESTVSKKKSLRIRILRPKIRYNIFLVDSVGFGSLKCRFCRTPFFEKKSVRTESTLKMSQFGKTISAKSITWTIGHFRR